MITFRQGTVKDDLHKILPMIKNHWQEVGHRGGPEVLEFQIPDYILDEITDRLKGFVAEEDNKIIGYVGFNIMRHPQHYNNLFASSVAIYIDPEYRKKNLGKDLIRFSEQELKKEGVEYVQLVSNENKPIDDFCKKLGYVSSSIVYTRRI